MDRPVRSNQFAPIINKLIFAKRFLLVAVLVQLLLLLPAEIIRKHHVFELVAVASAICGALGFFIAYRVLDLKGEALANSSLPHLVGPRLKAQAILLFMLAFLIPVINLVIILWAYARSSSAIRSLEQLRGEAMVKEKQRARLQGGVADAFRSPPPSGR